MSAMCVPFGISTEISKSAKDCGTMFKGGERERYKGVTEIMEHEELNGGGALKGRVEVRIKGG